jgi:hypothetical protein
MKKLVPAIGQAIKAQPGRKDELLSASSEFNIRLKGGELDAARQILDELQRIVQEVEDAGAAPQAPPAAEPASAAAMFTARLKALKPAIDKAMASGTPAGQEIKRHLSEAATLGRQKDFAQAIERLDAIEAILAGKSPPAEAQSQAAATTAPPSGEFVDYMKSRLAWESARKTAQEELSKLQRAMIEDTEEPEADAAETIKAVDKLAGLLGVFDEQLSDALDDALNAGPDDRRKHHRRALKIAESYLAFIDRHPILLVIDDNPFESVRVSETLSSALADIAGKLSA